MASVSKGYTFGATETVTATKLHDLVDLATITGIVNADVDASANVDSTKLNLASAGYLTSGQSTATITGDWEFDGTTNFAGTTITDLGSVTTVDINGGTIDGVTIGASSAPTVTNLGTVTTADINGGTLDGVQIGGTTATGELIVNNSSDAADGLGSQGTAGQFLTSAGAGSNPTWSTMSQDLTLVSVTPLTDDSNSGDIPISAGKIYKVFVVVTNHDNAAATIDLRINSDSASNYNGTTDKISMSSEGIANYDTYSAEFTIYTRSTPTDERVYVYGNYVFNGVSSGFLSGGIAGRWEKNEAVQDFEIFTSRGFDGAIYLYTLALS